MRVFDEIKGCQAGMAILEMYAAVSWSTAEDRGMKAHPQVDEIARSNVAC